MAHLLPLSVPGSQHGEESLDAQTLRKRLVAVLDTGPVHKAWTSSTANQHNIETKRTPPQAPQWVVVFNNSSCCDVTKVAKGRG